VVNSRGRPGFGGIPAVSPGHQSEKHRVQLPALLGRAVVLARRVVLVSLPGQYAVLERSGRIRSVLAGARRVRYPRFQASLAALDCVDTAGADGGTAGGPVPLAAGESSATGTRPSWPGSAALAIELPAGKALAPGTRHPTARSACWRRLNSTGRRGTNGGAARPHVLGCWVRSVTIAMSVWRSPVHAH
jgi:hypothetical protein